MMFKAFVKDKETGESKFLEYEYDSKSHFIDDLKANGYSVRRVEPKDLYDFVLDNTNANKWDWGTAKKMYKEKRPLERDEFVKAKDDYLANYGKDILEKIGLSDEETSEDENKEEPKYEVVNDKSIDAIKDDFTPPGAKGEKKMNKRMFSPDMLCPKCNEPMLYQAGGGKIKCHKCGNEIKDETLDTLDLYKSPNIDKEDVKDEIDTNDNGKIEVDEMADFEKSLTDFMDKNPKGREDIPARTRR